MLWLGLFATAKTQTLDSLFAEAKRSKSEQNWQKAHDQFSLLLQKTDVRERKTLHQQGLYQLGICQKRLHDFPSAAQSFRQLQQELRQELVRPDTSDLLYRCEKQLAYVLEKNRDFSEAARVQTQLLRRDLHNAVPGSQLADRLHAQGVLRSRMNDPHLARVFFEEALYVLDTLSQASPPQVANSWLELGLVLWQMSDLAGAQACLDSAWVLRRQSMPSDAWPILSVQLYRSQMALDLGKGPQAESILEDLAPDLQSNQDFPELKSDFWDQRAQLSLFRKDTARALQMWELALQTLQAEPYLHRETGIFLLEQGHYFRKNNHPLEALQAYHLSLNHLVPGFSDTALSAVPALDSSHNDPFTMEALLGKARVWADISPSQQQHNILRAHEMGLQAIAQVRKGISSQQGLEDFRNRIDHFLENLLASIPAHSPPHIESAWHALAFQAIEEAHLGTLQWRRRLANQILPKIPPSLENQVLELEKNTRIARSKLPNHPRLDDPDRIRWRTHEIDRLLLRESIQSLYSIPSISELPSPLSLQEIQFPHPVWSVFWGKEHVYSILNTPQGTSISSSPIQLVKPQVDSQLQFLQQPGIQAEQVPTLGRALLRNLLGSAADMLADYSNQLPKGDWPRLKIVPDGPLSTFPFEVLSLENREPHHGYMGLNWALSYDQSVSLAGRPSPSTPKETMLALGASQSGKDAFGNPLPQLPGVRGEIKELSQAFHGQFWLDSLLRPVDLLEKASEHAVLHLACHGIPDLLEPGNSHLVLSSGASQNNYLFAHQLWNREIRTPLVVLNACHTAEGKILTGEGAQSLGYAFRMAGATCVVASRWTLKDDVAVPMTQKFYHYLSKGMSSDLAMLHSRLDLLKDQPKLVDFPHNWAGYMVYGHSTTVVLTTPASPLNWLWLLVLLPLIGWLLKKKPLSGSRVA